jgi:hypothetical protein
MSKKMEVWRKEQDLGSKESTEKALSELLRCGFISSPSRSIEYTPIKHYGTMAYTKRIAYAVLEDGTKIVLLSVGPAYFDRRPWHPHWADIKLADKTQVSPRIIKNGIVHVNQACELPVIWTPRELSNQELIMSYWGFDLGKKWQKKYAEILDMSREEKMQAFEQMRKEQGFSGS